MFIDRYCFPETCLITITLEVGAGSNVVLNFLLIPRLGIVGASIATLIGYTTSVIIVAIINQKMGLLKVRFRFILSALLVVLDFVVIGLSWLNLYLINLLLVIAILLAYKQDVGLLIKRVTRR
ncbi:MAG TPA: hypothetical protein DE117_06730 [Fervidobacterium sp.]|nr:hypothetical protein [Fervidobacterium sp.]